MIRMKLARRGRWVAGCGILAGLLILHAFYFDYGDRYLHAGFALIALAGTFLYPRVFTAALAGWLLLIGCAWAVAGVISPLPRTLKPGLPRAQVHTILGAPQHSLPSLKTVTDLGYAPPSPWRFPDDVPVEVFPRGHRAIWVFYDAQGRVTNHFVGGS
jgi:hypothetical protein